MTNDIPEQPQPDTLLGLGSSDGLGPVGWRYVPSEVWGDQVLTQDPKAAQLAREYGRDVEPLYVRPTPEAVAWALAEEAGEDPGTLIWEGQPPEPWGEVWCRYMPQAERLVKRLFGA